MDLGLDCEEEAPVADVTLLHLTDLHFGWDRDVTKLAERKLVLQSFIDHVSSLSKDWRPEIVCLSGDIGWKGKAAEYKEAKLWLSELLDRLGLDFSSVVVCAGNHDVDREVTARLGRPSGSEEADQILQAPIAEHNLKSFTAYSDFCREAGVGAYTFQTAPSYLVGHTVIKGVRFLGCNSSWFCKDEQDKGKLWLGLPILKVIEADGGIRLAPDGAEEPIVCLVHHPPDWWHESETNSYGPRQNTQDYLAHRCNLILTGHTHGEVRKSNRIAESAIHFTGGAAYSGAAHYNSYRVIRVGKRGVKYQSFEYDPRSPDNKWRSHGVNAVPFREGPLEKDQVAPAEVREQLNIAEAQNAAKRAARSVIETKSRQIKPDGPLPELLTFPVQVRVSEQVDVYGGDGTLRLNPSQTVTMPLDEAVGRSRCTLLLGDLGSGKSTLAATLVLEDRFAARDSVAFLIPARSLQLGETFLLADLVGACTNYINGQITPSAGGVDVQRLLEAETRTLLAIDGLDEVPRPRAGRLVRQLMNLTDQWPTLTVLATGRPVELAGVSYESWGLCKVPSLEDTERLALFAAEARVRGLGPDAAASDAENRLALLRQYPNLVEVATTPLAARLLWPRLTPGSLEDVTLGDLLHELLQERLGRWDQRDDKTTPASEFTSRFSTPAERAEMLGELALRLFAVKPLSNEAAESTLVGRFSIAHGVAAQAVNYFETAGLLSSSGEEVDFPSQPFQELAAGFALLGRWGSGEHTPDAGLPFRCIQFAATIARRRGVLDRHRSKFEHHLASTLHSPAGIPAACYVASETRDADLARFVVSRLATLGRRPLPGFEEGRSTGYRAVAQVLRFAGDEGWAWFHAQYLDADFPLVHRGSGIVEDVFRHWAWLAKDSLSDKERLHLRRLAGPFRSAQGLTFSILPCLAVLVPEEFSVKQRVWYWSALLEDDLFGDLVVERIKSAASSGALGKHVLKSVLDRRSKNHVRNALLRAELFPDEPSAQGAKSFLRRWARKPEDKKLRAALDQSVRSINSDQWACYLRWCLSEEDGQTAAAAALMLNERGEQRLEVLGDALVRGVHDGGYAQAAEKLLSDLLGRDTVNGVPWLAKRISRGRGMDSASSALWRLFLKYLDPSASGSPDMLATCLGGVGQFLFARYPEVRDGLRGHLAGSSGPRFREALVKGLSAARAHIRQGCAAALVVSNPSGEAEALCVLAFDREVVEPIAHEWEEFLLGLSFGPSVLASLRDRLRSLPSSGRALALALLYRAKVVLDPSETDELFGFLLDIGNSHLLSEVELAKGTDAARWRAFLERALNSARRDRCRRAARCLLVFFESSLTREIRSTCQVWVTENGGFAPDALLAELIRVLDDAGHRNQIKAALAGVRERKGKPSVIEFAAEAVENPKRWKEVVWSVIFGSSQLDIEDSGIILLDLARDHPAVAKHIGEAASALLNDPRTSGLNRGEPRLWLSLLAHEFSGLPLETVRAEVLKADCIEVGALRALLARLGEIPEGFSLPKLELDRSSDSILDSEPTGTRPQSPLAALLDYARSDSEFHPGTIEALDQLLFTALPDEDWNGQCAARGMAGRMFAETVRFCTHRSANAATLAEFARWPTRSPSLNNAPTFKRLRSIVSTAKNLFLAAGTTNRSAYAVELHRVIGSEDRFVAVAATELLAATGELPDDLVEHVLEDFAQYHTDGDADLAFELVSWASTIAAGPSGPSQVRAAAALRRAIRLLDSLDDTSRMAGSPYAHLFLPLASWCLGSQLDAPSIRLYLRGLRRGFFASDTGQGDRKGPTMLAVFHPLLIRIPHDVWRRILDGPELKADLAAVSLLSAVGYFLGTSGGSV